MSLTSHIIAKQLGMRDDQLERPVRRPRTCCALCGRPMVIEQNGNTVHAATGRMFCGTAR